MEKYIHNILEDDDPDTVESKDRYNAVLINNTQLQIFHGNMELNLSVNGIFLNAEINADELDSNSEEIFNTTWDLTEDQKLTQKKMKIVIRI